MRDRLAVESTTEYCRSINFQLLADREAEQRHRMRWWRRR
jgi:hypothetical protein